MKAHKNTYEVKVDGTTLTYQSVNFYRHVAVVKWGDGEYEIVRKSSKVGDAFWSWKVRLHDDYARAHGNEVFICTPRLVRDVNLHLNQLSAKYLQLSKNCSNSETYAHALNNIWEMEGLLTSMREELKARIPRQQTEQVA